MSLVVEVKVVPSSGRSQCVIDKSGTFKCYLKSPPEKGLANKELIKMVAKAVGATQNNVTILTGAASRHKRIKIITDMSYDDFLRCLGLERQATLF